jgi:hypothetical protein
MGLASLVDRCLAKRPIVRPQTAREILRDLDEAAGSRLTFRRHHAAAAVAAAVVAALGIAQYRVSLPRETLEENRIVVVPFQNVSGNRSPDLVGSMATTWIQQGFALLDPVQVIAQPVVGDEIAGSGTNTVDRFALARRLHAGTIVAGTYLAGDDSLRFQAQIYRTSSREVRGVASASVGSKGDTVEAINRLRERVLAAMGLSGWMPRGTDVHIPTIGAFREFVKAQERFDRRDYAAASERLERAITLDSTYQPALVLLATSRVIRAASDLHAWEAADSLVRSIEAKRDELPTNDRAVLDYFRARTNGNGEAAYRLSRDWVERDSSWLPYDQMGISAMRTNRGYAAIKAFLTASTFPQAQDASKSNLASAYHLVGDFAAERRIGEEYGIVPTRIVASATIGNEVLINQLLDGPISSSASDAFWAHVRFRAALELRAHGFDSQADTQLEKTLAFLRARPLTETPESRLLVADIMFELGHLDSASARYRELVREASSTISIAALGRMGTTAALLKDTATARRIANELAQIQRPYVNGLKTYWRAAIAASLGEKDLAVSLLDQSLHAGTGMTAFIHVQREFFSLHDYPAFKVLMHPRSD